MSKGYVIKNSIKIKKIVLKYYFIIIFFFLSVSRYVAYTIRKRSKLNLSELNILVFCIF